MPVLCSQPGGDVSHKPGGRLPLLSARPAVTFATLNRAATNFAAWWTEAQWVWTVCLRLLPDSVAPESSMLTTRLPSHLPVGNVGNHFANYVAARVLKQCSRDEKTCVSEPANVPSIDCDTLRNVVSYRWVFETSASLRSFRRRTSEQLI